MDWVSDWAARTQQDRNYGQGQVPVQEKVGFDEYWLKINEYLWSKTNIDAMTILLKLNLTFRSTANNVEIVIPVPQDADSPKFKTTIGWFWHFSCKTDHDIKSIINFLGLI